MQAVWQLLTDPLQYREWVDAHFVSVIPSGRTVPGQHLIFRAPTWGRWFRIDVLVDAVDSANHVLELTTRFPFGLVMKNRIAVAAVEVATSRAQFG